ncbi:MAG: hypothetical protein ABI351_12705 [Herbaspirillum sp.]
MTPVVDMDANVRTPSLNRHFALVLCLVLLTALIAATAGWALFLENRGAVLRESRFQFSLSTIRNNLESGLQLGLELPDLPQAQSQIEQTRIHERDIISIDIFDALGHILFTTDDSGVGANLPHAWRAPCLAAINSWQTHDEDGSVQCVALRNSYEQVVGGVLLRYSQSNRTNTLTVLGQRWPFELALLLSLSILGIGAGWLLLRPLELHVTQLTDAIATGHSIPTETLINSLSAALQALTERERELDSIEREADRLDNLDVH